MTPTETSGGVDLPNLLEVSVYDGKYTVIQDHTGRLFALRYGQPWRDLIGDNLVLALAEEIDSLRKQQTTQ